MTLGMTVSNYFTVPIEPSEHLDSPSILCRNETPSASEENPTSHSNPLPPIHLRLSPLPPTHLPPTILPRNISSQFLSSRPFPPNHFPQTPCNLSPNHLPPSHFPPPRNCTFPPAHPVLGAELSRRRPSRKFRLAAIVRVYATSSSPLCTPRHPILGCL